MQDGFKNGENVKKFTGLLRENTRLLDQLFKALLDGKEHNLFILSDDKIEYANPKSIKTFGFSLKELQGKAIDKFFQTNHRIPFRNYLAYTTSKRKTDPGQIKIKVESKGGGEKWYLPSVKRCLWKGNSSLLLMLIDGEEEFTKEPNLLSRVQEAMISSNQGFWEVNYVTGNVYVSPECFLILGYKPGEVKTTIENWHKLIHSDFWGSIDNAFNQLRSGQINEYQFEYKTLTKSGDYAWVLSIGRVVEWDRTGAPVRIVGINMNIDKKKKVELEKDETRNTLEELIKKINDGLAIVDQEGIVQEWNPALERITQVKKNQAIGRHIWDVKQSFLKVKGGENNFKENIKKVFRDISHTGKIPWDDSAHEMEMTMKDGEKRIVQNVLFPIHTPNGIKVAVTVRNVTQGNLSRIKLEKSEERLKLALSAGKVGIWDVDLISGEKYFSPICFQILGYMPWEIEPSHQSWVDLIHPDDRPAVDAKIMGFQNKGNLLELVFRMKKKSGEYIWIDSRNKVSRNEVGKIERITGTINDISYQKEIELAQAKHREELIVNLARHEFLAEISIILNTNENFDVKINEVISKLGQFTGANRVYILENSDDLRYTTNTYEWVAEGFEPQRENQREINLDMILEWIEGKDYYTSNNFIADMPSDLAEMMISQGVRSSLIFPLYSEDNLFGFVGFDDFTIPRVWDKLEIELLKTISNLISFAFEREKSYRAIVRDEIRFREITEILPHIVFDVSLTGRIEFLNKIGCTYFGVNQNDIKKGITLKDMFHGVELFRMSLIREELKKSIRSEPVIFEAEPLHKKGEMLKIWVTPKTKKSRIVGYTGIALLGTR